MNIQQMIASGYCRISCKYGLLSRIDRPDWLKQMATEMGCAVADFYQKNGHGVSVGWADHYRRVYSKDTVEVGQALGKEYPASSAGPTEFYEKVEEIPVGHAFCDYRLTSLDEEGSRRFLVPDPGPETGAVFYMIGRLMLKSPIAGRQPYRFRGKEDCMVRLLTSKYFTTEEEAEKWATARAAKYPSQPYFVFRAVAKVGVVTVEPKVSSTRLSDAALVERPT